MIYQTHKERIRDAVAVGVLTRTGGRRRLNLLPLVPSSTIPDGVTTRLPVLAGGRLRVHAPPTPFSRGKHDDELKLESSTPP